jgi:hypothetical protein
MTGWIKCFSISLAIVSLLLVTGLFVWKACETQIRDNIVELQRIPSPDGRTEAIICEDNNFRVKSGYMIAVVSLGESPGSIKQFQFSADRVSDLWIRWKSPKFLEIHYTKARIAWFYNLWLKGEYGPDSEFIELLLVREGEDPVNLFNE